MDGRMDGCIDGCMTTRRRHLYNIGDEDEDVETAMQSGGLTPVQLSGICYGVRGALVQKRMCV
jgi:hypothetical protein